MSGYSENIVLGRRRRRRSGFDHSQGCGRHEGRRLSGRECRRDLEPFCGHGESPSKEHLLHKRDRLERKLEETDRRLEKVE